jgi:TrmH family RNA methyltransferase
MGAVFGVPVARMEKATGEGWLPGTTVALVPGQGPPISELWRSGSASRNQSAIVRAPDVITIMIGSERDGLPDDVQAQADHVAHIPILSQSLNAAMAATIALYELAHRIHRA